MRLTILLACAACTNPDPGTTVAAPANDIGIRSLVFERSESAGESSFELRGLDADGNELGRFHMRIGAMPDMAPIPGPDLGTDITITAGADAPRIQTRQVPLHELDGAMPGTPDVDAFLGVAAGVLKSELDIDVHGVAAPSETQYGGLSCPTSYMRPSPVAQDCCYNMIILPVEGHHTYHIAPDKPTQIQHRYSPSFAYYACSTASGSHNCSGGDCYYGPCGFSKSSQITNAGKYPVITVGPGCSWTWSTTRQNPPAPDITGTCPYTDCLNGTKTISSTGYWNAM